MIPYLLEVRIPYLIIIFNKNVGEKFRRKTGQSSGGIKSRLIIEKWDVALLEFDVMLFALCLPQAAARVLDLLYLPISPTPLLPISLSALSIDGPNFFMVDLFQDIRMYPY
jgi:hypothetical protein